MDIEVNICLPINTGLQESLGLKLNINRISRACEIRTRLLSMARPLEEDQPQLPKTIVEIAMQGSAAEGRRRNEIIRSVKTLDEMTEELRKEGFNVSRNGDYIRLLPKRSASAEGKRHVVTVPVKLMNATNDKHVNHVDGKFCTATIRNLEELASLLDPNQVFFLSQDDKARVPISLSTANKQGLLISRSVYLTTIGSAKYDSSTAYSHSRDLDTLLKLPEFESAAKLFRGGLTKPIFIFIVDGGPDENPRYEKVISTGIHHFVENNLDALFIATNAPGRSAFNRVERRMAPLSRELAGLILPHDKSHLDDNGIFSMLTIRYDN
ncbi:hypothetical protein ILUMI_00394 [Ignelater luminosus]|uniref:Uncharacterized protein n=1 Tax=Ignelater luminosus TaxID=2038154 RepID=A0A8K0DLZ4_IGNLU|nr:hypothetical protein ILUMI_00394 [Ignelater luminosus]